MSNPTPSRKASDLSSKARERFTAVASLLDKDVSWELHKDTVEWVSRRGVDVPLFENRVASLYADHVAGAEPEDWNNRRGWMVAWLEAQSEAYEAFLVMAVEYATGDRKASV